MERCVSAWRMGTGLVHADRVSRCLFAEQKLVVVVVHRLRRERGLPQHNSAQPKVMRPAISNQKGAIHKHTHVPYC